MDPGSLPIIYLFFWVEPEVMSIYFSILALDASAMMGKEPVWNFPRNGCPLLWIDLCSRSRPSSPKLSDLWFYPYPDPQIILEFLSSDHGAQRCGNIWCCGRPATYTLISGTKAFLLVIVPEQAHLADCVQCFKVYWSGIWLEPSSCLQVLPIFSCGLLIMCPNTEVLHFLVFWSSFDPVDVV